MNDIKVTTQRRIFIHVLGTKWITFWNQEGIRSRSKEKWQLVLTHAQRAIAYQIEEILMIKTL
jgi:hypothetical protein